MSRISKRDPARRRGAVDQQIARVLDAPSLPRLVPHLAPETLHRLVRHCGLDACVDVLTSATPAQLTALADLDLWHRTRAGSDETFDIERFGEWLEVLAGAGPEVVARTVAALDPDVVVAGLSRYVRVLDPGIFEPTAQSDDEPMDRGESMREGDRLDLDRAGEDERSPSCPEDHIDCEVGGYIVRARRREAWDAVVALLIALDTEDPRCFHAVMQGCRRLSNSRPETDGLDDLLLAPEQHLHDVALARERRRSQQGYATPADARAFLQMARQRLAQTTTASFRNPIVAAYFRAADEAPAEGNDGVRAPGAAQERRPGLPPPPDGSQVRNAEAVNGLPALVAQVVELLDEAEALPKRPLALLAGDGGEPDQGGLTHLRRLMAYVRDTDETAYLARSRELAFLANILLAGCSVQSRSFTTSEASEGAAAVCNLGLEHWPVRWPDAASPGGAPRPHRTHVNTAPDGSPPDAFLVDHDLVTAFEVGWLVLYNDVCLFAVEQLISTLAVLRSADREIRDGLSTLRRALVHQRDAGTPWRAREAAEVLVMLDTTAWVSVLGLLDECPVLPDALVASLEGRRTRVSATGFAFISTASQVGDVRLFMRKLADTLTR